MSKKSRKHTNGTSPSSINLILADVLMSGILGMIFLIIMSRDDKGLLIKLAPYNYETEDTLRIPSSAILHLDIDSASQLFIDSVAHTFLSAEKTIEDFISKKFLTNSRGYIWLRVSRYSRYKYYIQLRDIVKRAESVLLNDLSIRFYGESYSDQMPFLWRKKLAGKISICIIEEDELGKPYFELNPFCNCYKRTP